MLRQVGQAEDALRDDVVLHLLRSAVDRRGLAAQPGADRGQLVGVDPAERLLADARTGAVRLRVPVKSCTIGGGNASGLESNTGAIVADSRAELSDESVRFFVSEAERADQQALQLNELIGIIDQLRRGVSP